MDKKFGVLERDEWDLGRCPADQLDACFVYEYSRSTPGIVSAIGHQRKSTKVRSLDFPFVIAGLENDTIPMCRLSVTRDFPRIPFLTLSKSVREKMVKQGAPSIIPAKVTPDAKFISTDENNPLTARIDAEGKATTFIKPWLADELLHLKVNWLSSDDKIARDFKGMLPGLRASLNIGDGKRDDRLKRTHRALRSLGALRLWRQCGSVTKAADYAAKFLGDSAKVYANPSEWSKACKTAEKILSDFQRFSPVSSSPLTVRI